MANKQTALLTTYGIIALILIILIGTVVIASIQAANASSFKVVSADLSAGQKIPNDLVFNGFGCTGKNISPALHWTGAPAGTQSYAVTMYDPDAPTGSGWWHWIIYNIPGNSDGLPQGLGSGATPIPKHVRQARNDYGAASYGGPCPPVGDKPHRYIITVYALPTEKLDVPDGASAAMIGFALKAQAMDQTFLTALYGR
jgi:Raf kinase inhibitor-like YbhB/YbcL family protein